MRPTDAYALAKQEAEIQCKAFTDWFDMDVAAMRIHEVAPLKDVQKEHQENWDEAAVGQLWGWVSPEATARACLLACTSEKMKGFEVFNVIAGTTTQETSSRELAQKYYPKAEIKGDWGKGNESFFTNDKAKEILEWTHDEKE